MNIGARKTNVAQGTKNETDAHEHRCGSPTDTSSAATSLTEKTAAKQPLLPPLTYNRSTRHTAQNTFSNSFKKRVCQKLCAFRQHVSQFVLRTKPTTISEVRAQMRWRNNPQTRSRPHKKTHTGRMAPPVTIRWSADLARETWHNQRKCAN